MLSQSYPRLFYVEIIKLIQMTLKKDQSWRGGRTVPISNKNCVACIKDSHINQCNRTESPEIDLYING